MKHLDLFSGIGGFALATEMVWDNVEHIFCDNEPFAQAVLKKHWPNSTIYGDIRTLTADAHWSGSGTSERGIDENGTEKNEGWEKQPLTQSRRQDFDLLTGGFPCQPFSQAGARRGTEDSRHLWPEMLRVIREFSPLWVIAENVRGLLTQGGGVVFERVCTDLEAAGYEVQPIIIPAVAVGAPHRRDRVWFVAHRKSQFGYTPRLSSGEKQENTRPRKPNENESRNTSWGEHWIEVAQRFCQLDDGLPYRLAGFMKDDTCAIMGYILLIRNNFYGTKNSTRTKEKLFALQKATTSQAFSELLRGYGEVQKEEVLRCNVHGESNDERESRPWSLLSKSEKVQRQELRKVWHDTLTQYPPYQRGLDGQCSCQFDDIVRELSSPIALAEWEENAEEVADILFGVWKEGGGIGVLHEPLSALQKVWQSLTDKEIGSFRRHYYKRNDNRNPRLKALGNAIVPAVAAEIMRVIKEIDL